VKLAQINEAGLMKVENATTPVLTKIRKEKKADIIKNRISATTLSDIASAEGQSVRSAAALTMKSTTLSGAGREPKVVGAAFGLSQGEVSKAIVGEKGVYFVEVTQINEADELDNYASIANRLSNTLKSLVNSKVYSALQEAADIEDNRAKTVY
jgi:parvulin-like peptidyl-prolyl isomerase